MVNLDIPKKLKQLIGRKRSRDEDDVENNAEENRFRKRIRKSLGRAVLAAKVSESSLEVTARALAVAHEYDERRDSMETVAAASAMANANDAQADSQFDLSTTDDVALSLDIDEEILESLEDGRAGTRSLRSYLSWTRGDEDVEEDGYEEASDEECENEENGGEKDEAHKGAGKEGSGKGEFGDKTPRDVEEEAARVEAGKGADEERLCETESEVKTEQSMDLGEGEGNDDGETGQGARQKAKNSAVIIEGTLACLEGRDTKRSSPAPSFSWAGDELNDFRRSMCLAPFRAGPRSRPPTPPGQKLEVSWAGSQVNEFRSYVQAAGRNTWVMEY